MWVIDHLQTIYQVPFWEVTGGSGLLKVMQIGRCTKRYKEVLSGYVKIAIEHGHL